VYASDGLYYYHHAFIPGKAKKNPENSHCSHVVSVPNVPSDKFVLTCQEKFLFDRLDSQG
jgi:hypothetical protein